MSPEGQEERQRGGLTRERLVDAGLELVNEQGLEGLSMRALADRLDVKAASLYWHVRDREELLELLAEAILETASRPRARATWRETVLAIADALRRRVAAQKDAGRILLEVPSALERSGTFADLRSQLQGAGLPSAESGDLALLVMTYVITGRGPADQLVSGKEVAGAVASLAIDSGSRGVVVRAGFPDMRELVHVPHDRSAASPAVVRGETVVVRRLRGVGRGEIELNPRRPWNIKIQAPTWNTVLDLGGLDLRQIWIDSGAANVNCFLPKPRGVVPLHVSSGTMNIAMHRPNGVAVVALAHTGAVKLRLDDFSTKVTVLDVSWQSERALGTPDRYELDISSGVVDFSLDTYTPRARPHEAPPEEPAPTGKPVSALEILLDGVEARVKPRN